MKAFGDMGQAARLRLIRDRFIAGHSSCELRRHLDSVPLETPIRDVVDRCRIWESHADPAVRRLEMTIDGEPLAHSVPNVTPDSRPMEGIPGLEPLEHSVLVGALDSGLMEGMSHLEPLEHSVLDVARGDWYRKEASIFGPLEHSVLKMTLDDGPWERMSDDEPLEHRF